MPFFGRCAILPCYDTDKVPYIQCPPMYHRNIRFVTASALPQTPTVLDSKGGRAYNLYGYAEKISISSPTIAGTENKLEGAVRDLCATDMHFKTQLLATGRDIIIFDDRHWFWGRTRLHGMWVGRNEMGEVLMHVRDLLAPPPRPRPRSLPLSSLPTSPMFRTPPPSLPGSPLRPGYLSPAHSRPTSPVGVHFAPSEYSFPGASPRPFKPQYGGLHSAPSSAYSSRASSPVSGTFSRPNTPLPTYLHHEVRARVHSDNTDIMHAMAERKQAQLDAMAVQQKQRDLEHELEKRKMLLELREIKAQELRRRLTFEKNQQWEKEMRGYASDIGSGYARSRRSSSTPFRL